MVENRQVETKRLWELAKAGKSAEEIMEALDIRDMALLEQALENLMREQGERVEVPGLTGRAGLRTRYTERGIRIDGSMLEGTAFRPGDAFNVRVSGDRITLVKSGPSG
jgi:hypothetical protein